MVIRNEIFESKVRVVVIENLQSLGIAVEPQFDELMPIRFAEEGRPKTLAIRKQDCLRGGGNSAAQVAPSPPTFPAPCPPPLQTRKPLLLPIEGVRALTHCASRFIELDKYAPFFRSREPSLMHPPLASNPDQATIMVQHAP